jgi:hypothetical protein
MSTIQDIEKLIRKICVLSKCLPKDILRSSPEDKIWTVLHGSEGDTPWETFNRRFDTLFAEHCRDADGRLIHIRRGQYGMDAICAYLNSINFRAGDMPFDLVELKLLRLSTELVHLVYVQQNCFSSRL